jgi:CheY-like chemotaxis protein
MVKPVVLVLDEHDTLEQLQRTIDSRFGADYRILAGHSPTVAMSELDRLATTGEPVALVIADLRLPGMTGVEFLDAVHQRHPAAKRVLLVAYGDIDAGHALLDAMAMGEVGHYLNTPWGPPELQLYPVLAELLGQWARATMAAPAFEHIKVVGPRWSARSHELRDLLSRNSMPFGFYDEETDAGHALLLRAGQVTDGTPVVLLSDGRVLRDPTSEELAKALGVQTPTGAGPLRPHRRRSRPSLPSRGHVRSFRRPDRPAPRASGRGRPGGHDVVDSQLPRLSARHQRRGVGRAGDRAGHRVRRRIRPHRYADAAGSARSRSGSDDA